MFYDTRKNDHGLPHNPFKAIVAPRPIGWITSMSAKGEINLAPYSFFNAITDRPPIVMFSSEGPKDSVALAEETKEFVCSLATYELREAMNETSAPLPRGTDEMKAAGLAPAPSRLVKPPRVAASPCALECKWLKTVKLDDIDGKALDRYEETLPEGKKILVLDEGYSPADNTQEFLVPPKHYFMMGDNRDNSADSRFWGFVPDQNIVGRAFFIWFNFDDLKRFGGFR